LHIELNTVQYLFTGIVFPHSGSGPYTCTQKARAGIYVRKDNTDHRTHKRESKTYKTM